MGELWNRLTARQKRLFPWLALLLVVGSGLLLLQSSSPREAAGVPIQERPAEVPAGLEDSLARELTDILNAMLGGRRCAVFVTMDRGAKINVAQNVTEEVRTGPEGIVERRLTSTPVLLRSDAERREMPLVLEQIEPQVRGVLVVVDADPSAELRLAIAQAVATALQLPMYRIEVVFKQ